MYAIAAGHTDRGKKRLENEDCFLVEAELGLFVVSDGMGGHEAGELASATAVATVARVIKQERETLDKARKGQVDRAELTALAEHAVLQAAHEIYQLATSGSGHSGMGCTLTVLLTVGPQAVMAHVGDSRLYLCRDGDASLLSTDHTVAHELVKAGLLEPSKERESHLRSVLSRAVGTQPAVQVDTLLFDVLPGDRLVLCTDGLSAYLPDAGWLARQVPQSGELETTAEELVSFASQAGGHDNITVVVVRIDAKAPLKTEIRERAAEVRGKVDALASVFLFEDLSLGMQAAVLEHCELESYQSGELVMNEDAPCSCLFIVVEGRFDLTRQNRPIDELAAGDYVGITTLLRKRPARATLRALEPSKLLRLEHDAFWALVRSRPWLGVGLLERLGQRLSASLDRAIERREGGKVTRLAGERF